MGRRRRVRGSVRNGVVILRILNRRAHLKQQHARIADERERDAHKTETNDEEKDIYSSAYVFHLKTPQNNVPRSHMRSSIPARFSLFSLQTHLRSKGIKTRAKVPLDKMRDRRRRAFILGQHRRSVKRVRLEFGPGSDRVGDERQARMTTT